MNDHSFRNRRREGVVAKGWKSKYFALDPLVKERFERLCGALGLQQSQIVNKLLSRWVEENEGEVRLDLYVPHSQVVIKHADRVNIDIKAEVTFYKIELQRILPLGDKLRTQNELEYRNWLQDLAKVVFRACRVQANAQDPELGELLAKAVTHLK